MEKSKGSLSKVAPEKSSFEIEEGSIRSSKLEEGSVKSKRENGISAHLALINFLKGMIGPGCFSLPLAFKQAGLWTGFALVFIIGILCAICMMKLVKCSQFLAKRNPTLATLDYAQMAAESFKSGPKPLHKFSTVARIFVNLCIVSLQIGVISIYFIFVCDHAKELVEYLQPQWVYSKYYYMLIMILPFLFIAIISRNVRIMSYISLAGNFFMIASIILIYAQLIVHKHEWKTLPWITDFNGVVLAAGAIIYSFEGQAMVLPLENRMKHGSEMRGFTGVLSTGMALITIVYSSAGFYGYISYGNQVLGSITLNLPDNQVNFYVKILLILAVYTGFPLILYPAVESLWPALSSRLEGRNKVVRNLAHYGLRAGILVIAVSLAAALPNLEDIIPLVGVTCGMLLALAIPAVVDTTTFLPIYLEERKYFWAGLLILENAFLFIVGLFFLIAGIKSNVEKLTGNL